MKPETQQLVNEKLADASSQMDASIGLLCECVSALVLERQFVYADTILHKAMQADSCRAACRGSIIEKK